MATAAALAGDVGTSCPGLAVDLPTFDLPAGFTFFSCPAVCPPRDPARAALAAGVPAVAERPVVREVGVAFRATLRTDDLPATVGAVLPCWCSLPTRLPDAGFPAADFVTVLAAGALRPVDLTGVGFFPAVALPMTLPAMCGGADLPCAGFATTRFGAADFFGAGLATAFFTAGGVTRLAAAFTAGLAALRTGFADALAFLASRFVTAVGFTFAATAPCVLAALFFWPLVVVELRVVFAISFHHSLAVAAGCYNPCILYRQACFWNTCTIARRKLSGYVNPLTRLILCLLHLYKRWLSPLLGPRCRFHPSCSDYARIAVTRFGPWRGSVLALWRVLRCQPLCQGGNDPVPEHFHFPPCRGQHESPDVH